MNRRLQTDEVRKGQLINATSAASPLTDSFISLIPACSIQRKKTLGPRVSHSTCQKSKNSASPEFRISIPHAPCHPSGGSIPPHYSRPTNSPRRYSRRPLPPQGAVAKLRIYPTEMDRSLPALIAKTPSFSPLGLFGVPRSPER